MCIEQAGEIQLTEPTPVWKCTNAITSGIFTGPFWGTRIKQDTWMRTGRGGSEDQLNSGISPANLKGWHVFPRREDAVTYADNMYLDLPVLCWVYGWCGVGIQDSGYGDVRVCWSVQWIYFNSIDSQAPCVPGKEILCALK